MPIEAIEIKLFDDGSGSYHLTVERRLPVPGDDAFDLTVRESEAQKQTRNIARVSRPDVLKALLEHGDISDGQRLYFLARALPAEIRASYDPDRPLFQVVLDASAKELRFRWRPDETAPEQILPPSAAWHSILESLVPGRFKKRYHQVASWYAVEADGETLGELAERTGAWASNGD
jgi:hypothetical protein